LRKIDISDLRGNGVPLDFATDYTNSDAAFQAWEALSKESKLAASAIYRKIDRHNQSIENLTAARLNDTMRRLGIERGPDGRPAIRDKKKISDFIFSELERRELPRN